MSLEPLGFGVFGAIWVVAVVGNLGVEEDAGVVVVVQRGYSPPFPFQSHPLFSRCFFWNFYTALYITCCMNCDDVLVALLGCPIHELPFRWLHCISICYSGGKPVTE